MVFLRLDFRVLSDVLLFLFSNSVFKFTTNDRLFKINFRKLLKYNLESEPALSTLLT